MPRTTEALSTRVAPELLARIDAYARAAGVSRYVAIAALIEVGLRSIGMSDEPPAAVPEGPEKRLLYHVIQAGMYARAGAIFATGDPEKFRVQEEKIKEWTEAEYWRELEKLRR